MIKIEIHLITNQLHEQKIACSSDQRSIVGKSSEHSKRSSERERSCNVKSQIKEAPAVRSKNSSTRSNASAQARCTRTGTQVKSRISFTRAKERSPLLHISLSIERIRSRNEHLSEDHRAHLIM